MGTGEEEESLVSQLDEVIGEDETGDEVVDADEIEIAAIGELGDIAIEQDDGDAGIG